MIWSAATVVESFRSLGKSINFFPTFCGGGSWNTPGPSSGWRTCEYGLSSGRYLSETETVNTSSVLL
jgi:hypothetical protein